MEISRLTSGTPFASGLLPHFCSHALAVKRGGSRVTIKPEARSKPHRTTHRWMQSGSHNT
eukprot:1476437-Pleurochrysis_carterae.AAC.1